VAATAPPDRATTAAGVPIATTDKASDDELPPEYDQDAIYRYWSRRPVKLFERSLETTLIATSLLAALQLDKVLGREKNPIQQAARARALRLAIDRLGPAYIKVAQARALRLPLA
jgi:aarF domain-containing kinase